MNVWANTCAMVPLASQWREFLNFFMHEDPQDIAKAIFQNSESVMFSENKLSLFSLGTFLPSGFSSSEFNVAECWAPDPQRTSLAPGFCEMTMTWTPLTLRALLSVMSRSGAFPAGASLPAPHLTDFTKLLVFHLKNGDSVSY